MYGAHLQAEHNESNPKVSNSKEKLEEEKNKMVDLDETISYPNFIETESQVLFM